MTRPAHARALPVVALLFAALAALGGALGACAAESPAASAPAPAPKATSPVRAATTSQPPGRARNGAVVPLSSLPGWPLDSLSGLRAALERQCRLARAPAGWTSLCAELSSLARPDDAARDRPLREWLESRFVARPLGGEGRDEGLITGYHEPVLTGSRWRDRAGQVPLYRRPADLVRPDGEQTRARLVDGRPRPYWTRAQIERDEVLKGQELLWLDDPVEAFFLHVQGSGRVRMRDGSVVRVGFADHNGQPYRAIGRVLIDRGELQASAVDADTIKAWLRSHPGQATELMQQNPRYVFFRELAGAAEDAGPIGSLGVPLTAMRSVATDPQAIPPGALLWLQTTRPDDGSPLERAVVSQDTGAAITGSVRADLFWGSGEHADRMAALMKQRGRLWLLEPTR